jgi:hypothetical protein
MWSNSLIATRSAPRPVRAGRIRQLVRDRCDEAGLPKCSAHELRKAGASLAAENSPSLPAHGDVCVINDESGRVYTRTADQKWMAGEAWG